MSEICPDASDRGSLRRNAGAFRPAEWLSLVAAPTFAIMALLTGVLGEGASAFLCSQDMSPLGGMTAMYWLMSVFHTGPWLRLISGR
jgi:hypothetical protein